MGKPQETTSTEREQSLAARIAELEAKLKITQAATASSVSGRLVLFAHADRIAELHALGVAAETMPRVKLWHQKGKNGKADHDVFLPDLGAIVICRVSGSGADVKVSTEYGIGPGFAKPMPVDIATITALRGILSPAS